MLTSCRNPDLCPDNVYGQLGKCANCCGCFALAEEMIREAELHFIAKSELTGDALVGDPLAGEPDKTAA